MLFAFVVTCTVSIPRAFIWSALFSAMVRNFFGSDRASTIATKQQVHRVTKVHRVSKVHSVSKVHNTSKFKISSFV